MGRTMLVVAHREGVRRRLRPTCPIWGLLLNCRSATAWLFSEALGWSPQGLGPLALSVPCLRPVVTL